MENVNLSNYIEKTTTGNLCSVSRLPLYFMHNDRGSIEQYQVNKFNPDVDFTASEVRVDCNASEPSYETIITLGPRSKFVNMASTKHNAQIALTMALHLLNYEL